MRRPIGLLGGLREEMTKAVSWGWGGRGYGGKAMNVGGIVEKESMLLVTNMVI